MYSELFTCSLFCHGNFGPVEKLAQGPNFPEKSVELLVLCWKFWSASRNVWEGPKVEDHLAEPSVTAPECSLLQQWDSYTNLKWNKALRKVDVQRQYGESDCGLFAIACAITLCEGRDPYLPTYIQSATKKTTVEDKIMVYKQEGRICYLELRVTVN